MAIMNIKSTARRAGRKDSVEAGEGGHAPPVGVREVQRRYWRTVIDLNKKAQHFVYILMIT